MGSTAMLATGAAGAATTVAGAYSASRALQTQSMIRQQNLDMSKKLSEFQAEDALVQGGFQQQAIRQQGRSLIGSQRAAFAGNGIDVNQGSAAQIQQNTAAISELAAMKTGNEAWRQAFGFKSQAADLEAQYAYEGLSGQSSSRTTLLTGGMSAVNQLAQTYDSYKKFGGSSRGPTVPVIDASRYK